MVKSFLNQEINYAELKKLDEADQDYESSIYETNIMNNDIIIALGNGKNTYIDKNIVYYPIYLVKNKCVQLQIGVYEVLSDNIPNILDDEGDINLELLGDPLLYTFVLDNPEYLKSDDKKADEKEGEEGEGEEGDEPGEESDTTGFDSDEAEQALAALSDEDVESELTDYSPLNEQTFEDAKKERQEFKQNEDSLWIEQFMYNNHYHIINNEGGGDCLFAAIRDGLARVNKKYTVTEIRNMLADEATEELFREKREFYDILKAQYDNTSSENKLLIKKNKELASQFKVEKDRSKQSLILEQGKQIKKTNEDIKDSLDVAEENLREIDYMKNINTLEEFKEYIKTAHFWGEAWAIATLERVLNIKLVIFSYENFVNGDLDNVLQCGEADQKLQERNVFTPNYYVLLDYDGNHYQLITYKKRGAFTFKELPYIIKELVSNKCMEKQAGLFFLIKEFKEFHEKLGRPLSDPKDDITIEPDDDLYTNDIVFQYYNRSVDKIPGVGAGEKIPVDKKNDFSKLNKIKDWRKKLDSTWTQTDYSIIINNIKWASVENYYQAMKFEDTNKELYNRFKMDSGSEIATDPALAKKEGEKASNKSKISKIFAADEKKILAKALNIKFTQNDEMRKLLKDTKNAKLVHYQPRKNPDISEPEIIMKIRKSIPAESV